MGEPTAIVSQSLASERKPMDKDDNSTPTMESSTAAPEMVRVRTRSKPILATGFHSGVAKTVNHLFEWTEEALCAGSDKTVDVELLDTDSAPEPVASTSEVQQNGHCHSQHAASSTNATMHAHSCVGGDCDDNHDTQSTAHGKGLLHPSAVMPIGDPKLTKCDESTICPGLFLSGPQVRQDDQIFGFVYKYRQRFAVVMNEIATRMGLQTEKVVEECRKHHMFLDDPSCCKATCGTGSC